MRKTEAIRLLGGSIKSAATAIGISPSAVSQWPDALPPTIADRVYAALWRREHQLGRSMMPSPKLCVRVERQTAGAVMRWDLRPDDWHLIWPELIGTEGAPPIPAAAQIEEPAP